MIYIFIGTIIGVLAAGWIIANLWDEANDFVGQMLAVAAGVSTGALIGMMWPVFIAVLVVTLAIRRLTSPE